MIDTEKLMRHAAGDEGVAREVLALFREHAPGWVGEVEAAATLGDLRAAAHRIKGAARGIGADGLGDVAMAIEGAAAFEDCADDRARLTSEAAAVLARIELLLASAAPLGPKPERVRFGPL
ncbi:MAG: Hpt domain-containing protein [Alphaproteobacteria bacterium]|nr:Hpt domain-containing protein [Alphaproteobacteria bacterium]